MERGKRDRDSEMNVQPGTTANANVVGKPKQEKELVRSEVERRNAKRPDLKSDDHPLPEALVKGATPVLCNPDKPLSGKLPAICHSMFEEGNPQAHLRAQAQLSEQIRHALVPNAFKDAGFPADTVSPITSEDLDAVLEFFLTPILLEPATRYLHKGNLNIIRNLYTPPHSSPQPLLKPPDTTGATSWRTRAEELIVKASRALMNAVDAEQRRDAPMIAAMRLCNMMDVLSLIVWPNFHQAIQTLLIDDLLPVMSFILSTVVSETLASGGVDAPLMDSNAFSPTAVVAGSVFGEDLYSLRFVIRVLPTILHKELVLVRAQYKRGAVMIQSMFACAIQMLSSGSLPKDVLNAAAVLVCAVSGLPNRDAGLVRRVAQASTECGSALENLNHSEVQTKLQQECNTFFTSEKQDLNCFRNFTANGCLALFKAFLSDLASAPKWHPSTEAPDAAHLGTLLMPTSTSGVSHGNILNSIIIPKTELFVRDLALPETRFMALQTLDSVVQHVLIVAKEMKVLANTCTPAVNQSPAARELQAQINSSQTTDMLNTIKETLLALWDDPTQVVAGPLYDTYNSILTIEDLQSASRGASCSQQDSHTVALKAVLSVSIDRRGRYHSLLALLPRIPFSNLIAALAAHFGNSDAPAGAFATSLLSVMVHSKVANVAGSVLLLFAELLLKEEKESEKSDEEGSKFQLWVLQPTLRFLLPASSSTSAANMVNLSLQDHDAASVEDEQGGVLLSAVAAHFVTPLIKTRPSTLAPLLQQLAKSDNAERRLQAIVEVVHRAVGVGLSPFTLLSQDDASAVLKELNNALTAADPTLRMLGLRLLTLDSKLTAQASQKQCDVVSAYISLHLHNGGDSTTRNNMLTFQQQWYHRLVSSATTTRATTERKTETGNTAKKKEKEAQKAAATPAVQMDKEHYSAMVMAHFKQVTDACAAAVCLTTGVSLDRIYTSLTAWYSTINSARILVKNQPEFGEALSALFPDEGVTRALLWSHLEVGWAMLSGKAFDLLCLQRDRFPIQVVCQGLSPQGLKQKCVDALVSPRFREAEGAARRLVLFCRSKELQQEGFEATCLLKEALSKIDVTIEAAKAALQVVSSSSVTPETLLAQWTARSKHAVHGQISLISALLDQKDLVKLTPPLVKHIVSCCLNTLEVCTANVASAREDGGDDDDNEGDAEPATLDGGAFVDCRGHIVARGGADEGSVVPELISRLVVNNAWLGVRTSCACIEKVIAKVYLPSDNLDRDQIHSIAHGVMSTLLRTKHNGVISRAKQCLLALATKLLRTRDTTLSRLPLEFAEFLLGPQGVASEDEGRILRRSHGLPHALIPLLEAEDPSVPFVMLPRAMQVLVSMAEQDGDRLTVLHKINALNVLKFIFDDSQLASRISPWVESSFLFSIQGFEHSDWATRNSSLMLYASVLHRSVGDQSSKNSGGVTFTDLCTRFPRAMQYVHRKLKESVEFSIASDAVTPQPSVFPLLLLMSQLTPDSSHRNAEATLGGTSTITNQSTADSLVDIVMQCQGMRSLMARGMGAKALVSITPLTMIEEVVGKLQEAKRMSTTNMIHGSLLNLKSFLGRYVTPSSTSSQSGVHETLRSTVWRSVQQVLVSLTDRLLVSSGPQRVIRPPHVLAQFCLVLTSLLATQSAYGAGAGALDSLVQAAIRSIHWYIAQCRDGHHWALTMLEETSSAIGPFWNQLLHHMPAGSESFSLIQVLGLSPAQAAESTCHRPPLVVLLDTVDVVPSDDLTTVASALLTSGLKLSASPKFGGEQEKQEKHTAGQLWGCDDSSVTKMLAAALRVLSAGGNTATAIENVIAHAASVQDAASRCRNDKVMLRGLKYVTRMLAQAAATGSITTDGLQWESMIGQLSPFLAERAMSEEPTWSRLAAVSATGSCIPLLRSTATAATKQQKPPSVIILKSLGEAFRLLFLLLNDDEYEVRHLSAKYIVKVFGDGSSNCSYAKALVVLLEAITKAVEQYGGGASGATTFDLLMLPLCTALSQLNLLQNSTVTAAPTTSSPTTPAAMTTAVEEYTLFEEEEENLYLEAAPLRAWAMLLHEYLRRKGLLPSKASTSTSSGKLLATLMVECGELDKQVSVLRSSCAKLEFARVLVEIDAE